MEQQKEDFDYVHWDKQNPDSISAKEPVQAKPRQIKSYGENLKAEVEEAVKRIEASHTDITQGYKTWCDLGFALAEGLGEDGRSFYHRISQINPGYNPKECDHQYTSCLEGHGSGITIKTFFGGVREAGISLSGLSKDKFDKTDKIDNFDDMDEDETDRLPTFSDKVRDDLCDFLSSIADKGTSVQDADLLLLASLVVLSGCFPNSYYTIYDDRVVYTPLYLFVSARAATGKGRMEMTRYLGQCIDQEKADLYQSKLQEYKEAIQQRHDCKDSSIEVPEEPVPLMHFIPANSSAAAFCSTLNSGNGEGIMFETEGDTLTNTLHQDYGDYSDDLRKAYQHEVVTFLRKQLHGKIQEPRLAVILSGTPAQLTSLVPGTENGLFSRFMFYGLSYEAVFQDKFTTRRSPLSDDFKQLGEVFYKELYQVFRKYPVRSIYFSFTANQHDQLIAYYQDKYPEYLHIFGNDVSASIFRLMWITIRLSMVLTALRLMDTPNYDIPRDENGQFELICDDRDFRTAMTITECLLDHMSTVFVKVSRYAKANQRVRWSPTKRGDIVTFSQALHQYAEFRRIDACAIAAHIGHPPIWADRLLSKLCDAGQLIHSSQGTYTWSK